MCSSASTTAEEPPTISESTTMHSNFVNFVKQKLHVMLWLYDITVINNLPPRHNGKRSMIVQLLSAESKNKLMMKRGVLRGTDVYLNDHLSAHNSELFHQVRQLKCENKVYSTWTQHCCVFMKIRESGQRIKLKTLADFSLDSALDCSTYYISTA